MSHIEEAGEVSHADTDNDSGFCDDNFIDERLDIIEKVVQSNHTELIKVSDNICIVSRELILLGSKSGEET